MRGVINNGEGCVADKDDAVDKRGWISPFVYVFESESRIRTAGGGSERRYERVEEGTGKNAADKGGIDDCGGGGWIRRGVDADEVAESGAASTLIEAGAATRAAIDVDAVVGVRAVVEARAVRVVKGVGADGCSTSRLDVVNGGRDARIVAAEEPRGAGTCVRGGERLVVAKRDLAGAGGCEIR